MELAQYLILQNINHQTAGEPFTVRSTTRAEWGCDIGIGQTFHHGRP
jgi:hypothetical protein